MWYERPAKPLEYFMIVKLLTEHHLEFLSLKEGCTGSSEPTHVKMPHCWKSHALAQIIIVCSLIPQRKGSFRVSFECILRYMYIQYLNAKKGYKMLGKPRMLNISPTYFLNSINHKRIC